MNADVLVALFGGTGIATVISILYRIWKERHGNAQKDLAGDLTLGALFRDVARKEVLQVEADIAKLQATVRELRDCKERLESSVRDLTRQAKMQKSTLEEMERKYRAAQEYVGVLVEAWRATFGVTHPVPDPPEEYFPDSTKTRRAKSPRPPMG